jgi:GT2 family glycosyltransferase
VKSVLRNTTQADYEILLLESLDRPLTNSRSVERLCRSPRVKRQRRDHFADIAAAYNFGAQQARGEYLVLLSASAEVIDSDWIETMARLAFRSHVGAVAAHLLLPAGVVGHAWIDSGMAAMARHPACLTSGLRVERHFDHVVREVSAASSDCLMVKRNLFRELGGLHEGLEGEDRDVDFCQKLRARGLTVLFTPDARLHVHAPSLLRSL